MEICFLFTLVQLFFDWKNVSWNVHQLFNMYAYYIHNIYIYIYMYANLQNSQENTCVGISLIKLQWDKQWCITIIWSILGSFIRALYLKVHEIIKKSRKSSKSWNCFFWNQKSAIQIPSSNGCPSEKKNHNKLQKQWSTLY